MAATDTWHLLIVSSDGEGGVLTTFLHPEDCPVSLTHRLVNGQPEIIKAFCCATQASVDEAGFWGMFSNRADEVEPGYWWVRPWIEKQVGLDWTEYDGGWEVVAANGPEAEDG